MPTTRKPRHTSIESLSAPELSILTPEFLATLPKTITFPTIREARAARLYLYKILGAGRSSNIPHIEGIAHSISLSQATPLQSGEGSLTIFSRNDELSQAHPQADLLATLTSDMPTPAGSISTPVRSPDSRIGGMDLPPDALDLLAPTSPDVPLLDLAALGFSRPSDGKE